MVSDQMKVKLISMANTFIAAFVSTAGATLLAGEIHWNVAFWGAVGITAVRAGVKALIAQFLPVSLGGVK